MYKYYTKNIFGVCSLYEIIQDENRHRETMLWAEQTSEFLGYVNICVELKF